MIELTTGEKITIHALIIARLTELESEKKGAVIKEYIDCLDPQIAELKEILGKWKY